MSTKYLTNDFEDGEKCYLYFTNTRSRKNRMLQKIGEEGELKITKDINEAIKWSSYKDKDKIFEVILKKVNVKKTTFTETIEKEKWIVDE